MKFRTFDLNNPISIQAKEYILKHFYIDVKLYDVIIGYRADDSYFSFAKDFINNTISVQQLAKAMNLGNLGIQIVLKSQKAFEKIKYITYEIADYRKYYVKFIHMISYVVIELFIIKKGLILYVSNHCFSNGAGNRSRTCTRKN